MSDATAVSFRTYEERLDADPEWALLEGSRHFEETSAVHQTLRRICKKLDDLGIDYAVMGGMALFQHGFRRFTEDVDVLVSREGLKQIHQELEGRGYRELFTGSRDLRDAETGVRIEFRIAGQYPGDGKPKPVAFPRPGDAAVELEGIRYLRLSKLIELKLASGMTNRARLQDLADVQSLIEALNLPASFTERLDSYVRSKFDELWRVTRRDPGRYLRVWPSVVPATEATSLDDLIGRLRGAGDDTVEELEAMRRAGVTLAREAVAGENEIWLLTTDPEVARNYNMHEETEFLGFVPKATEDPALEDQNHGVVSWSPHFSVP